MRFDADHMRKLKNMRQVSFKLRRFHVSNRMQINLNKDFSLLALALVRQMESSTSETGH